MLCISYCETLFLRPFSMRMYLFCICFLLLFVSGISSAQELLYQKPLNSAAKSMTTDELGNVYIIFKDNSLVKYSLNGDSLGNYRSIQNGDLATVDASNPLKLLLFYPEYGKITFLDRMLSPKNEMDLKKLNLFQPTAAGMARDGNIWVYDVQLAKLQKIDEQLNVMQQSDDLRSATGDVLFPVQILDRDRKIYTVDTAKGIFVFDQYATILTNMDLFHVKQLQVFDHTLVYSTQQKWISYDLNIMKEQTLPLPDDPEFIMARIEKERIYYLFTHKLQIFRTIHN